MHLMIPFASAPTEPARHVLDDLRLPALSALLGRLTPTLRDEADEYTLSPPHERALARAWGWPPVDGRLPFAARAAAADGIEVGTLAWGLLTPVHWHVGREQVMLTDPRVLDLGEPESRALFAAVRDLFESEGFTFVYGAASRWYAAHECLAELPCAGLDRVIGRNVDLWLRGEARVDEAARLVRRLHSEVQMLLYPHAINEAREARGALTVNSFWLSGCGRHLAVQDAAVRVDDSLRPALLAQDWASWADAWRALDAGLLTRLLADTRAGADVALTLCGERSAQRFDSLPQTLRQRVQRRFRPTRTHTLLEAL
jgi:hypothetical protein